MFAAEIDPAAESSWVLHELAVDFIDPDHDWPKLIGELDDERVDEFESLAKRCHDQDQPRDCILLAHAGSEAQKSTTLLVSNDEALLVGGSRFAERLGKEVGFGADGWLRSVNSVEFVSWLLVCGAIDAAMMREVLTAERLDIEARCMGDATRKKKLGRVNRIARAAVISLPVEDEKPFDDSEIFEEFLRRAGEE